MARDPIGERFGKRQDKRKLSDLAKKARSSDDVEAEKELIKAADKAEPIKADGKLGRNSPCPCGSGKKYKNCCGREG